MPNIDLKLTTARAGRIVLRREPTDAETSAWSATLAGSGGIATLVKALIALPEVASLSAETKTARACDAVFGRYDPHPPRDINHWMQRLSLGDQSLSDLIDMFAAILTSDYRADPCASPVDRNGKIFAVRAAAGSAMVFATGENQHLYLFLTDSAARWQQLDLSSALPAPTHAHVQAVDIRQAVDGSIDIALAAGPRLSPVGGNAFSTVYVATGLKPDLSAEGWLNAFRAMKKHGGGPAEAIVSGIKLTRTAPNVSSLVLVGASVRTVSNTWYFDSTSATDAAWTFLRVPEDADKVINYAIGHYAGHPGLWTLYRVTPDVALTFTTFAPDQYGKNINISYTGIPAGVTSFLVAAGSSPIPDVYVAGEGVYVYRASHDAPELIASAHGATVLWAERGASSEHVAYVDSKAALQVVTKSAGQSWRAPVSLTTAVEVAALLGDPFADNLSALVITPSLALELRHIAKPGATAQSIEIPLSAVWDQDPLTQSELKTAIANASPVVHFYSSEQFLPSTVQYYLERTGLWNEIEKKWQIPNGSLWDAAAKDINREALAVFSRSPASVASHDSDYCLRIPDHNEDGSFNSSDIANSSDPAYQAVLGGHPQDAAFYLHAKFAPFQNATDLVFWGCFPYNGGGTFKLTVASRDTYIDLTPLGEHEGDWEHTLIRVDNNTLQPVQAYMSAHNGGSWIDLNELGQDPATGRREIYMSYHGHASYPSQGDNLSNTYTQGVVFAVGLANRCNAGLKLNLGDKDRVALISAGFLGADAPAEPMWLQLPWRWGRYFDHPLGFGSHSRARRCASAIWPGVIQLATSSRASVGRWFTVLTVRHNLTCTSWGRSSSRGLFEAERLSHMCART